MTSYILSHDLGTTGDKATLFTDKGILISSTFYDYPTYYPDVGWAEQNPDDYWRAFCSSTKALLKKSSVKAENIAVVSFSGQMMAALPVDKDGDALRRSIIWADLRSTVEAESLSKRIGRHNFYELTGNRLSASYPATKIMWIKRNEPKIYKNTYKFINAKDYVAAKLTRRILSDYSDASSMALLNIKSLDWATEILEASGIDKGKLPDLIESTDVVGKVCKHASMESGLMEGTPVVKGAGDGPCATAGSGVVQEGESYIYIGTSTWMGLATRRPFIDSKKRTHTFCHFTKGLYAPAGTMQAGGGSFQWLKNTLCDCESSLAKKLNVDVYEILTLKAKDISCGSGGLIFLPYLMGERCPFWNPDARGCFIGLSMLHSKSHMIRSVLEGVAYNMKLIEEAFIEQGADLSTIRMIGGGAKSPLWRTIFADVMEKRIARLNFNEEATSIGAAIAGGVGVGMFSSIIEAHKFVRIEEEAVPNAKNVSVYREYYEIFKKSYEQLVKVFSVLSS